METSALSLLNCGGLWAVNPGSKKKKKKTNQNLNQTLHLLWAAERHRASPSKGEGDHLKELQVQVALPSRCAEGERGRRQRGSHFLKVQQHRGKPLKPQPNPLTPCAGLMELFSPLPGRNILTESPGSQRCLLQHHQCVMVMKCLSFMDLKALFKCNELRFMSLF